jgi:RNA polymerase sigma factor (sigma-70 family)
MNELVRLQMQVRSSAIAEESNLAECFLNRYRDSSFRIAIRIVADSDLAEDVVQEALIRAFKSWDQLASAERQSAWVRRIVVRCALTALHRKHETCPLSDTIHVHEDLVGDIHFRNVLSRLGPEQQALLGLAIGEGLSYSEIAEALDISPGTVASRLHHAKAAFRKAWEGTR